MKGSQALVEMLKAYRVGCVFGVPGDTGVSFYDALRDAQGQIKHVLARDERSAAFMADCYARVSNRPGVCEGPSGAGATHMLPGVAEAFGSSVAVIALTTDNPLSHDEKGAMTALDHKDLYQAVTKWCVQVKRADMLPELLRKAFRMATGGRPGAVQVALPKDVLDQPLRDGQVYAEAECSRYPSFRTRADSRAVRQAADILREARRPVVVCGGGALISQAWGEVTALAEALGAPVGTTINGKGSIAENHPLSIGVVGGNGGRPYANRMVQEADLVFYVGSKVNYVDTADWTVPSRSHPPSIIQLDVDSGEIGNNYPVQVGLCGDAKLTLQELLAALHGRVRKGRLERATRDIARAAAPWWEAVRAKAASDETPIRPQYIIRELEEALPSDHIIVADCGTPTPFVASQYRLLQPGRRVLIPRAHGGLGYAIPGVVGAKVAAPDSTVVGLCGDGSFAMSAGDLATIHQLGKPVLLLQLNNGCYGWIKMLQKLHCHGRYFGVDFCADTDYVKIAEGFGLRAWRVENPRELGNVIRKALAENGPTFIDVVTAPEVEEVPPVEAWTRQTQRVGRPAQEMPGAA
jgi:acetolactate synthase-1/2/3 large subunit